MDLISNSLERITPQKYMQRVKAFKENRRTCSECSAKLAWDNKGPLCGPCHKALMRKTPEKPSSPLAQPKKLDKQEQHHTEVSYAPRSQHSYLYGLESIMEEKGVSNLHLARQAKMNKDTISSYRITRTRCHPDRAAIIAEALGVSVEELKSE